MNWLRKWWCFLRYGSNDAKHQDCLKGEEMTDQPKPEPKKKGGFLRNLANAVIRIALAPLGAFKND